MLVELMRGEERARFGGRVDAERNRKRRQQRQRKHQEQSTEAGDEKEEWTSLPKSLLSALPDPRRWPEPQTISAGASGAMIQRAMAPALMANFDTSNNQQAKIRYLDDGEKLVVEWKDVYLQVSD